jgi:hypothetical protein
MRILLLLALLVLPAVTRADEQVATTGHVVALETFDQYQPATFPGQWQVRGDESVARVVYRVAEENGNRFLHAHADKQEVQIGLSHAFEPKKFPLLRWRWRVAQLPAGADERAVKTNDSAAGVYVVFDNRIMPRAIKYVWSATLPVGTRIASPVYWRAKVVVLESGPAGTDEWRQETVNFYQDYKDLFEAEPGEVQGIGLLTDANTTESVAEADYDDFTLLSPTAVPTEAAKGTTAHLWPALTGGQH